MKSDLIPLINNNPFEIFDITPSFNIDLAQLDHKYRLLQKKFHPDNYMNSDKEEQALSLTVSANINNAYIILTSPLLLSLELLKLNNIHLDLSNNTSLNPGFLIKQMEFHEEMDEAETSLDIDKLHTIENKLKNEQEEIFNKIKNEFVSNNFIQMAEYTKELAFYDKLLKLLNSKIDKLW